MSRIINDNNIAVTWGKRNGKWFVEVEDKSLGIVYRQCDLSSSKVIEVVSNYGVNPVYVAHTVFVQEQ